MTILKLLPGALAERAQTINDEPLRAGGDFVLYWMHHAMRDHDNPALDAALHVARARDVPVLVYQGLGGAHRFNADRHHLFILQGARDVAAALAGRGIEYVFHLAREPATPSPLAELAGRAAAVICEQMPVPPFPRWQSRLASRCGAACVAVDTRCIVPMQLAGRAYDRAFKLRDDLKGEFAARVPAGWTHEAPAPRGHARQTAFEPYPVADRTDAGMLEDIAALPIDHSVPPVADTPGGTAAGYARWETFLEEGLPRYARLRNDAAERWPAGVSRMSPYLHYGQVSPFRLARDAADCGGKGAEKFIDELTIWRELAHNLCFYGDDLEALSILPGWARDTLESHAADDRDAVYSWERLSRGETGQPLWDLAQRSLLVHGELHNNLRMTWAKAIVGWSRSPDEALAHLVDLNHRYALDGNDPNSYGGLLWALGLFDRPFKPEKPVLGTVRPRDVESHMRRLDMDRYRTHIKRPQGDRLRVVVVGAGIAGLSAARVLHEQQHDVVVLEKSRGPGGRTATRRRDAHAFDHGAQYFTARDPRLRQYLPSWEADGVIERWPQRVVSLDGGRFTPLEARERWRARPGMNALAKHLARDIRVVSETRVEFMTEEDSRWRLTTSGDAPADAAGPFDAVIVSVPPAQAAALLDGISDPLREQAAAVEFEPCWAVMLTTATTGDHEWQAAFCDDEVIGWLANDAGRSDSAAGAVAWTVHATAAWSRAHLETEARQAASTLADRFARLTGLTVQAESAVAHRWRYARAGQSLTEGSLYDAGRNLVVCGDWCAGPSRIENAWLSGQAAAGRLLGTATFGDG